MWVGWRNGGGVQGKQTLREQLVFSCTGQALHRFGVVVSHHRRGLLPLLLPLLLLLLLLLLLPLLPPLLPPLLLRPLIPSPACRHGRRPRQRREALHHHHGHAADVLQQARRGGGACDREEGELDLRR